MKIVKASFLTLLFLTLQSCLTNNSIIVVGHRGASGYAPENTLSSLTKAMEQGAVMSEIDVQETADGEIILLHDTSLKRTGGVDKNIWEINYSDLKDIDVGSWFSDEYKNEHIPTLQEVIDLVSGKMKLNIELKTNGHEKQLAERTLKIVADNNFLDQVVFTSFKFNEIKKIRKLNKKAKVGYILGKLPRDINVFKEDVDLLSVNYKTVDKQFMDNAKKAQKEVAVWTVNESEYMQKMIKAGVDYIITNYPDRLIREINN